MLDLFTFTSKVKKRKKFHKRTFECDKREKKKKKRGKRMQ
jgi:hypothetical protein